MKVRIGLLAVCMAVLMLLPGPAFAARRYTGWFFTSYTSSVNIAFTDDFHSNLSALPKVKGYFAGVEQQNSASILLDAGDFSMGTPYETVYAKDAPELHVMDEVGYDLIGMGTSEFSLGMDQFLSMLASYEKEEKKEETTPVVSWFATQAEPEPAQLTCANVTLDKETAKTVIPYKVLEAGTRRIAVFSLIDPSALTDTDVKGEDPVSAAKDTAAQIMEKEKPDVLVCLYSGGKRDEDFATEKQIAEAAKDISLIISSGSGRKTDKAVKAGSARIVSAGGPERIGTVTFTLKDEKMVFDTFSLGLLDKTTADDADVAEAAAKYKGIYDKDYFKAYGYAYHKDLATLDAAITSDPDAAGNDALGRLVSDAYRYTASKHGEADVAVVSAEALKEFEELPEGKIETKTLYQKLRAGTGADSGIGLGWDGSVGTGIKRAYISGAQLLALVNAGVSEGLGDKQLIFSGIKCTYNPNRFGDDKLYDLWIMLQDGKKEELEPDRLYCIILDDKTAGTLQSSYTDIWESMTDAASEEEPEDADPAEPGNIEGETTKAGGAAADADSAEPVNAEGETTKAGGAAASDIGTPVMRDKSREVKRWVALAAYLKKQGSEAINSAYGADGTALSMITYDYSKNPLHIFKEREKLLGVFIAIAAIIIALILLLILFIRGRSRSGRYPRRSSAARLQYKRYRKQKQRPIFKRRKNRYK